LVSTGKEGAHEEPHLARREKYYFKQFPTMISTWWERITDSTTDIYTMFDLYSFNYLQPI